jgi:hypothetical protein
MGYWQPKHQFSKSLRDFLLKIPGVISGTPRRALSPPPAVHDRYCAGTECRLLGVMRKLSD